MDPLPSAKLEIGRINGKALKLKYSWISHKRPPILQTFNGHIQVVVYVNQTKGSFPRKDPNTSTFWMRIHSMQFLIHIIVQFHVVSKSSLYTLKSVVHTAKIDIKTMPQMVAYRGLKQWKILKTSSKKVVLLAYKSWSFTRSSDTRHKLGKFWCFGKVVIYGRWSLLWEVVAYGGLFHFMPISIQYFIFGQG